MGEEWTLRTRVEHLDFESSPDRLTERVQHDLAEHGVAIVNNYRSGDEVERLSREASDWVGEIRRLEVPPLGSFVETDEVIVNHRSEELAGKRMTMQEKPVANVRAGADEGMIDCFNVDLHFDHWRELLCDEPLVEAMSRYMGVAMEPKNLNLYYNESITSTRGYHVDSWSGVQVKAFLYLSDVLEEGDGPHAYVVGSHRRQGLLEKVNRPINRLRKAPPTDCRVFDPRGRTKILGPKGTLFISLQSGAHRGVPQAPGRERLVLVRNYKPA